MRTLLLAVGLFTSSPALACGQSTHVWIALHALDHLPDGPLADVLKDPDVRASLINGAMFPDGGYSPLTQDPYGETAHWEPFQTAFLDWIGDTYPAPYDATARQRIAFVFGMAAHGMADQAYDGVYLTRSLLYDGEEAWGQYNSDHATDVAMVTEVGPQPVVDDVVPYDDLATVFASFGLPTSTTTMGLGQTSLRAAIQYVSNEAADPVVSADYVAQFPWANAHLTDPDVPGSPACLGRVVAGYWQTMWDRLNGTFDPSAQAVFWTWPDDGTFEHPTDALSIESQVSLAFARGIDLDTLSDGAITVTDADGAEHPVELQLYYGNGSNVVNVSPVGDWAEDTTYTVTVLPGITSFDDVEIEAPWTFGFTTGPEPTGCGCDEGAAPGVGVLVGPLIVGAWRRRRPPTA